VSRGQSGGASRKKLIGGVHACLEVRTCNAALAASTRRMVSEAGWRSVRAGGVRSRVVNARLQQKLPANIHSKAARPAESPDADLYRRLSHQHRQPGHESVQRFIVASVMVLVSWMFPGGNRPSHNAVSFRLHGREGTVRPFDKTCFVPRADWFVAAGDIAGDGTVVTRTPPTRQALPAHDASLLLEDRGRRTPPAVTRSAINRSAGPFGLGTRSRVAADSWAGRETLADTDVDEDAGRSTGGGTAAAFGPAFPAAGWMSQHGPAYQQHPGSGLHKSCVPGYTAG
jgi:hypothetical protein